MENEQINEILADMISAYATPGLGRKAVLKTAQKLAVSVLEDSAEVKGENAFKAVRNAIDRYGSVLSSCGESMVCGVILSGAASMNPCYVIIRLNGNRAEIKAYAKEGLIKQHTAEKAVKSLKEALSD
ncbi:MAG: hypothetical protein K2N60_03030 [Oscillospiraceae bacterium]|nr:hypothetical protein [Oscillospiraceae bacterium]